MLLLHQPHLFMSRRLVHLVWWWLSHPRDPAVATPDPPHVLRCSGRCWERRPSSVTPLRDVRRHWTNGPSSWPTQSLPWPGTVPWPPILRFFPSVCWSPKRVGHVILIRSKASTHWADVCLSRGLQGLALSEGQLIRLRLPELEGDLVSQPWTG